MSLQIPDYLIPRYIRFTDSFPLSPIGKVLKSKLLENLQSEIGKVSKDENKEVQNRYKIKLSYAKGATPKNKQHFTR
jgi:hypothetical protein